MIERSEFFDGEALKISVVIENLTRIMDEHGDVSVYFHNIGDSFDDEFPVEAVKASFIEGKIQALIL